MSTVLATRKKLCKFIEKDADDRIVKMIEVLVKQYSKEENQIIGYNDFGQAITKEQLLNDVQKARNDIKLGKGTKIDELEKESLTW
ncbi:MAG: hypothetical protein KA174_01040 [Chitinophagales bacterium]|nr:hypothetical protein [Saprospirales bacterium]MBK8351304.1 hypothetical protein [Saprospirales bacterium]MBP6659228.1 hypothetical protein [Chitinophagales bacterium]